MPRPPNCFVTCSAGPCSKSPLQLPEVLSVEGPGLGNHLFILIFWLTQRINGTCVQRCENALFTPLGIRNSATIISKPAAAKPLSIFRLPKACGMVLLKIACISSAHSFCDLSFPKKLSIRTFSPRAPISRIAQLFLNKRTRGDPSHVLRLLGICTSKWNTLDARTFGHGVTHHGSLRNTFRGNPKQNMIISLNLHVNNVLQESCRNLHTSRTCSSLMRHPYDCSKQHEDNSQTPR